MGISIINKKKLVLAKNLFIFFFLQGAFFEETTPQEAFINDCERFFQKFYHSTNKAARYFFYLFFHIERLWKKFFEALCLCWAASELILLLATTANIIDMLYLKSWR